MPKSILQQHNEEMREKFTDQFFLATRGRNNIRRKEIEAQNKALLEKVKKRIEEVPKRKFPRGERKWCIECAKRIKRDLLNQL